MLENRKTHPLFAVGTVLALALLGSTATQAAEISGTVLDPGGQPVSDATVRIVSLDRIALTASDGSFVLDELERTSYRIRVTAPGYAVWTRNVDLKDAAVTRIEVVIQPIRMTESVTVSPSYSLLERRSGTGVSMGKADIEKLPHFGNDLYRAIAVLPSTTSNDISSRFR